MGNLNRISLLKQFTLEEPKNPFNWYALALELQESDTQEAQKLYSKLLNDFPDYLPTYYHAAHFFEALGELDLAQETYEKGMALAKSTQEHKTLKELANAYQNFLFEHELD